MRENSATDFIDWQTLFEEEVNEAEKLDWYLAQIAFEIHQIPGRIFGKASNQLQTKDFLLRFSTGKPAAKKINPADRIAMSKAVWGMAREVSQSGKMDPRQKQTPKQIMDRAKALRALQQRIAQRKREQAQDGG